MDCSGSLGSSVFGCLKFAGLYMNGVAVPGIIEPHWFLLQLDKKEVQHGRSLRDA